METFTKEGAEIFFFDRNFETDIKLKHKYDNQLHLFYGNITHIEELEAWINKVFDFPYASPGHIFEYLLHI